MTDRERLVEEAKVAISQTCIAMKDAKEKLDSLQATNMALVEKLSGLLIYTNAVIEKFREDDEIGIQTVSAAGETYSEW